MFSVWIKKLFQCQELVAHNVWSCYKKQNVKYLEVWLLTCSKNTFIYKPPSSPPVTLNTIWYQRGRGHHRTQKTEC